MIRIKILIYGIFNILLLIVSCDHSKVFDSYEQIDPFGWRPSDTITFEFELDAHKENLFNSLIGLRHNNNYLYANIFFFVDRESPSGSHEVDTLQYLIAEPDGKWLGSGVGEIKHNIFKFNEHQEMESGKYKYKIVHGMRDDVLIGVEDIGLRIERSN